MPSNMNRLVLIDGNAILHRAYHAIPPLTAPDGSVVNAVYGFATMLMKIYENLTPSHMAVAFDRAAPTFRKKLFDGYQSKRPEMDKDLVSQIDRVHELVESFGIPIFEKDGYEADDVIGTLASKAHQQVIIVTGDRDILQLVEDEKILVYMPTKGLSEAKLYGEKEVVERMGVVPKLIPDLKGLMGDSSDNYPGVPGIGPKTAIKLLVKYKSMDGLLKSKELTPEQKESARMSYDLATIRTNAPIVGKLVEVTTLATPAAIKFLEHLRFHSLLKKLNADKKEVVPEKKEEKQKANEQQGLF